MNHHLMSPKKFDYQKLNSSALFLKRALGQIGKSKEMGKRHALDLYFSVIW